MHEQRLYPLAVEQAQLQVSRDECGFWRMRIAVRAEGQPWAADSWVQYDRLSLGELADTLLMELSKFL